MRSVHSAGRRGRFGSGRTARPGSRARSCATTVSTDRSASIRLPGRPTVSSSTTAGTSACCGSMHKRARRSIFDSTPSSTCQTTRASWESCCGRSNCSTTRRCSCGCARCKKTCASINAKSDRAGPCSNRGRRRCASTWKCVATFPRRARHAPIAHGTGRKSRSAGRRGSRSTGSTSWVTFTLARLSWSIVVLASPRCTSSSVRSSPGSTAMESASR